MKDGKLGGLDYFKMAAAFLVVAIHTSPFASFGGEADFVFTRIAARTAVPFFLMVTGYFMLPWYLFGKSQDFQPLFRYMKKVLLLYVAAVIIYLPVNVYAGQFAGMGIGEILRMVVFDGTFYHLWYLPATALGVWIVYLLSRINAHFGGGSLRSGRVGGIALLLYIIGLFGDSYYGLVENVSVIRGIYDGMFRLFSYTRNGIFYVPIFLYMGAWISRIRHKGKRTINLAGFILSFSFMIVEGLTLHRMGVQRHDSMYIALLPCMFFLFQMILSIKIKPAERLRTISTWIYLIHPLVIIIVRGGAKAVKLEAVFIDNSLIHYLAVCLLSYIAAALIQIIFSRKSRPRSKKERAWVELSRDNLHHNIEALQDLLPSGCQLMPVIKANAYGHGAVLMARELNACGIKAFCVAAISEAVELRQRGIKGDILILGYTHPNQFPLLRRYRLVQTVVDSSYAKILNAYGKKVKVHIKIDTGMHRLGERCEKTDEICEIFQCKNLVIEGIYTHLSADDATTAREKAFTDAQGQAFYEMAARLEKRGYRCPKIHLLASYGLLNYPELAGDYARIGIALYGVLSNRGDIDHAPVDLHPILSVKARVAAVKELFRGESAGYGFQYTADRNRKIAVLTIGYADGLSRALSGGCGQVIIKGVKVPIIGYICMDQTIVDVSDIADVKQGDVAVIIGGAGDCEITAYDLAERTGTITNEILSCLGGRLDRIMV